MLIKDCRTILSLSSVFPLLPSFFSLFLSLSLFSPTAYADGNVFRNSPCTAALDQRVKAQIITEDYVDIDNVLVTGWDFTTIQGNLGLSGSLLSSMAESGRSVLTVGEGISELLPTLLEYGISAKALDLWYHSNFAYLQSTFKSPSNTQHQGIKKMIDFQKQFKPYLIRGSAFDMPLEDESKDFVLSHLLVNNLHISEQLLFFSETLRILKVGGEARILLLKGRVPDLAWTYQMVILQFLDKHYGKAIHADIDTGLLKIKKLATTKSVPRPNIEYDPSLWYKDLPAGSRLLKLQREQYKALPTILLEPQ